MHPASTPGIAPRITALSGGVGGAKLVLGLSRVLPAESLTTIVNTGDDFVHFGLAISPDLDTLMYTLAGEVNEQSGWGRRDETWNFMAATEALGGATWFRLGDRDLATHAERTHQLAAGSRLTEVTATLCARFGIATRILPMTDDEVRTRIETDRGELDFQHYFVRDRAEPRVRGLEYAGAAGAQATPEVLAALEDADLTGIVIAPSNPYLSIDPILAIPDIRKALRNAPIPRVAVSPIVGGAAIKGPAAKIMAELGQDVTALNVASHYRELIDGFILDEQDREMAGQVEDLGLEVLVCNTIMRNTDDKIQLAEQVLGFTGSLATSTD
jgi:LPPG:FO 2-phospho-L-lactate transferase